MVAPLARFDPVDAFLSGISSVIVRALLAAGVILAACGLALLCSGWGSDQPIVWFLLFPGAILLWGTHGGWIAVGLVAAVVCVASFVAFVREQRPKLSLFSTFSGAALYFAPVTFTGLHWLWLVGVYACLGACYWLIPILARARTI